MTQLWAGRTKDSSLSLFFFFLSCARHLSRAHFLSFICLSRSLPVLLSSWMLFERSRSLAWECCVINLWDSCCCNVPLACLGDLLWWIITAIYRPRHEHDHAHCDRRMGFYPEIFLMMMMTVMRKIWWMHPQLQTPQKTVKVKPRAIKIRQHEIRIPQC